MNSVNGVLATDTLPIDIIGEYEYMMNSQDKVKENVIPQNFVLIPAGENKSQIHIDSFYLDKYELTQGEYKRIMGQLEKNNHYYDITNELVDNGKPRRKDFIGDSLPVIGTYKQFATYCQKRSAAEGYDGFYDIKGNSAKLKGEGNGYRLVTSYEWAYAAKGGANREKYKYVGGNRLADVAWFGGNSASVPHKVGEKTPNSLGLYDMAGNISEMFEDTAPDCRYCSYGNYLGWVGFNDEIVGGDFDHDIHQGGTRIVFIPRNQKNNNTKLKFKWE